MSKYKIQASEELFNKITNIQKDIHARLDVVKAVVQNDMEVDEKDIDEWIAMCDKLKLRYSDILKWQAEVMTKFTEEPDGRH